MRIRLPHMILVAIGVAAWASAQSAPPDTPTSSPASESAPLQPDADIEKRLAPLLEEHQVPALAGAIVSADGALRIGAVGLRRRGGPEAVTIHDRFHIGSCGKAMTATLLARLVERGKLSWETTLAEAFPELADDMHADYRGVTLEQLLAHRAGMPQDLNKDGLWARMWQNQDPRELRLELLRRLTKNAPSHAPGSTFEYSNAGFAIAGAIAERVTNTPFDELIRRELFEPLHMTSAGFGAPGKANVFDEPRGHSVAGIPVEPGPMADNPRPMAPAGTMHFTLRDWSRFAGLHLAAHRGDTPLLKKSAAERMHTAASDRNYVFGWIVGDTPWAKNALTHAGSNTMWYCVIVAAPEEGFALLVATNSGEASAPAACNAAIEALAGLQRKEAP